MTFCRIRIRITLESDPFEVNSMIIRDAKQTDLKAIMSFYAMMCEELGKKDFLPKGNKGGFPPPDMVLSAIENQQLHIGVEEGCIEGNSIPHQMYRSRGFQYIDTVEIFYVDIGEPRKFLLFEKIL